MCLHGLIIILTCVSFDFSCTCSFSCSGSGGVGGLYFNAKGEITNYKTLLSNTNRNCGGGLTPVSCSLAGLTCSYYDTLINSTLYILYDLSFSGIHGYRVRKRVVDSVGKLTLILRVRSIIVQRRLCWVVTVAGLKLW